MQCLRKSNEISFNPFSSKITQLPIALKKDIHKIHYILQGCLDNVENKILNIQIVQHYAVNYLKASLLANVFLHLKVLIRQGVKKLANGNADTRGVDIL